MIVARATQGSDRLQAGDLIRMTRATHGDGVPEGWTFLIMFGETEVEMLKDMRNAGMVGPETETHIDPRL